jgi:CubicO group peptidase (beta-lactamase class C family)
MRSRFLLGAALLAAAAPATAQTLPDSVLRKVDQVFAAYDRTDSPGCAMGIYRDGRILYARGYGMANLELGIALSPRSVLDIGSTSKQFTAFAVALLEQAGKLSQADPVRKYLPELGAYADGIKVADLVHHTSGLRDYLVLLYLAGFRDADLTDDDDALRLIVRQQAANFAPNTEWLYSNTGYFLLSVIVKRVSGKSLRAFAQERMFTPLGMRATHFHDDHAMIVENRATGYSPAEAGGYGIEMSNYEQTGDGAIQTSIEEMLPWDGNFYDGKVGGMDLVRRQQVPAFLLDGKPTKYASGLMIDAYRGLKTVRHGGAWAGYRAELLRFPDQHTSIACLCNRGDANPSRFADKVADVILAGQLQPVPVVTLPGVPAEGVILTPDVLKARAGVYRGRKTGDVRIVRLEGSQLALVLGRAIPMVPLSPERFQIMGEYTLVFATDNGKPTLRAEQQQLGDDVYELVPAFTPTAAQLAEFAGAYYAEELDAEYRITADSAGLDVGLRGRRLTRVTPTFADAFSGDQGENLLFSRDRKGRLTGFTVGAGRVRNILFVRRP